MNQQNLVIPAYDDAAYLTHTESGHNTVHSNPQSLRSKRANLVVHSSGSTIMPSVGESSLQDNILVSSERKNITRQSNQIPKYHGKYINLIIEFEELSARYNTL